MLLSKLLKDQVLKERYESLREFIEPAEPNDDDIMDEEWHDNMYWERNGQQENFDDDDDDIEVGVHLKGAHWLYCTF